MQPFLLTYLYKAIATIFIRLNLKQTHKQLIFFYYIVHRYANYLDFTVCRKHFPGNGSREFKYREANPYISIFAYEETIKKYFYTPLVLL
jgi:hypothetical protein